MTAPSTYTKIFDETGKAIGSIDPWGFSFDAAAYGTTTTYKRFNLYAAAEKWIRKQAMVEAA